MRERLESRRRAMYELTVLEIDGVPAWEVARSAVLLNVAHH